MLIAPKKKLDKRLKKTEREFEKLTGKKVLKMQGRKKLPCISESCKFEGVKLKQHLMSKSHIFSKTHAELAESFENKKINIYFY